MLGIGHMAGGIRRPDSNVFAGPGMQYILVAFVSLQECFVVRWADLSDTAGGSEPVRLNYQLESELAQCSPTYLAQSTKDVQVNRLDEI